MNRTAKLECKPRFFMSASLKMSTDKDYLNTLVKGGTVCIYLVTGCDLYSIKAFQHNGQRFFDWGLEIVKKLQEAGHHVYISHGLGFDFQDKYVFDAALEFSKKANIETTEFYIFIPFPQTHSWHRLRKENRILHYNWTKYNTANVVFEPKNLTELELLDGFIYCWKEFLYEHTVEETLNIFTNDMSRNI